MKQTRRWLGARVWAALGAGSGLLLAAGCGGARAGSATIHPATTPPPSGASGFANPGLIVTPAWVKSRDSSTGVVVLDARPSADYDKGHLPGAVSLAVTETVNPATPKNYPSQPEVLAPLLSARGVSSKARVVVYDGGAETAAPRLFWTLEYLGHRDVAVLDGGVRAWQTAGGELVQDPPHVADADFAAAVQPQVLHRLQDCLGHVSAQSAWGAPEGGAVAMLDSRSAEEYRGEDVRAKFGGHIPGAVNVDWRQLFGDDARLKEPAALAKLYEAKGLTRDKLVVAYCQTGQRSSVSYWSLRLLGYPRAANYAGSWVEWGNDSATPKVQGDA